MGEQIKEAREAGIDDFASKPIKAQLFMEGLVKCRALSSKQPKILNEQCLKNI